MSRLIRRVSAASAIAPFNLCQVADVGDAPQNPLDLLDSIDKIQVVMAIVTDPVRSGLVASLARPGGNLTGVSIGAAELGGKRLELLLPSLRMIDTRSWR